MPRYSQVLFDLDGTLIDSAPAILASYRDAFASTAASFWYHFNPRPPRGERRL